MGILVTKNQNDRSILQEKINADLRARVQSSEDDQDFSTNVEYLEDTQKTSRFGWVWFVLIALAIVSVIVIVAL